MSDLNLYPVIMCGGVGARLWPVSTPTTPKQFLPLFDGVSPFQHTVSRLAPLKGAARLVVVAGAAHETLIKQQLDAIGAEAWLILEPAPRDSAAAIAAAAAAVSASDPDGVLAIVSSDNYVADEATFVTAIEAACQSASKGQIVTIGLRPQTPSPAFGYILPGTGDGAVRPVERFVEKPSVAVAETYLTQGYLWNSGNFMAPAVLLVSELEAHSPQTLSAVRRALPAAVQPGETIRLGAAFTDAPKISIDYAVMEKTAHAAVLPVDFTSVDIGSWKAVWDVTQKDAAGNAVVGDATLIETSDAYVRSTRTLQVAVVGLSNIAVVVEGDRILVCALDSSQLVKQIPAILEDRT